MGDKPMFRIAGRTRPMQRTPGGDLPRWSRTTSPEVGGGARQGVRRAPDRPAGVVGSNDVTAPVIEEAIDACSVSSTRGSPIPS
jgi:hypothetical protein